MQVSSYGVSHLEGGPQVGMAHDDPAVGEEGLLPVAAWGADGQQVMSTEWAPGARAAISPNTASPFDFRYHSMCVNPSRKPRALSTATPISRPPAR